MTPQLKILFVDDEPWLSQPLRMTLEAHGYACVSCSNMTEGLEYLENNKVAVLVTDIMMPAGSRFPTVDSQTTGFKFVELVRQKYSDMSIVCLSVIGDQDKIEWLKNRNAIYLRKGETPLATAVKMIISKATGLYSAE
jgi:DNA-binding response OmpR family regulator